MKSKVTALCLAFLLAAQLCIPASAAEAADGDGLLSVPAGEQVPAAADDALTPDTEDLPIVEPPEAPAPEPTDTPAAPETSAPVSPNDPDELVTIRVEPKPGEPGLFQDGAFSGPQSIPGEVELMADYQELKAYVKSELERQSPTISIASFRLPVSELSTFYFGLINDNPDLFYVISGYSGSSSSGFVTSITPQYAAFDNLEQAKKDFAAETELALKSIEGISDPLEQVLTLHDYLTLHCAYANDTNAAYVHSAYGALVNGNPVCQGYALAFKHLLNQININCILVNGAEAMNHVWNAVELNGAWYHIDVTWDDPKFKNHGDMEGYSGHEYFLCSNTKMSSEGADGHYGWDESLVPNWGTMYDSGWLFNDTEFPVHCRGGKYYYIGGSAGYSQHTIYETNTLHTTSGISVASITSAPHCGFQWYDNALYFIPNNSNSQTNLLALDLDNKKRIQLEPFSRTGSEDVGLKFKDSKIIPYRSSNHSAGSCPELASLSLLPSNWKMISDSYGISNDGKTLFWGSKVPNAGQALWIAAYNNNRMTFVGRVIGTGIAPQLVSGADLMMQPFTSSGTPGASDTVKSFLLNSSTFAPVA